VVPCSPRAAIVDLKPRAPRYLHGGATLTQIGPVRPVCRSRRPRPGVQRRRRLAAPERTPTVLASRACWFQSREAKTSGMCCSLPSGSGRQPWIASSSRTPKRHLQLCPPVLRRVPPDCEITDFAIGQPTARRESLRRGDEGRRSTQARSVRSRVRPRRLVSARAQAADGQPLLRTLPGSHRTKPSWLRSCRLASSAPHRPWSSVTHMCSSFLASNRAT
jgi:hypothetical protein